MRKVDLEILISTMDRTDLLFLDAMFPDRNLDEFNILIINQTEPGKKLKSEIDNIRIINSFERGLSKSRNLALENSIGKVALIADDDIIYLPNFDKIVLNAFQKYPMAAMISFQFLGKEDLPKKKYTNHEHQIVSLKNEPSLSSWEIAFNPNVFTENTIRFNEYFGLGANFPSGEETLLAKDILNKKLPIFHVPQVIGKHPHESTGTISENENYIRGVSALKQLKYGKWAWLSLMRFVYLSVKNKKIRFSKFIRTYQIGLSAIKECKELYKNKKNPFA